MGFINPGFPLRRSEAATEETFPWASSHALTNFQVSFRHMRKNALRGKGGKQKGESGMTLFHAHRDIPCLGLRFQTCVCLVPELICESLQLIGRGT